MKLIIVESPTKGKTLRKFLGKDFLIEPTLGHIRDLPKNKLGVNIENNFSPSFFLLPNKKKIIERIKNNLKKSEILYLATDPDREGESIAWHILEVLKLPNSFPYKRIVFHEITKEAILKALKQPRDIDQNLVSAQKARRILDRLVGYKLSPFLWKKITKGLSAGRVQSVALRLIVEREKEIENFSPKEYWTIEAILENKLGEEFKAKLVKKDNKIIPKLAIKTEKEAKDLIKELKKAQYKVEKIVKKEIKKSPPPPFTTSTLQQEAWQKFRWPARLTIKIAQELYETGKITYHRTDSLNLSELSLRLAKKFIIKNYGENYYQFRKFKTKSKLAQEAHEAIRPTYPERTPQILKKEGKLDKRQFSLYQLIWQRFIASQMKPAVFDSTTVEISAKNYLFEAKGQILKFDGFLKVYPLKIEQIQLPTLLLNEILKLKKLIPLQHFTKPPSRYTEASLIRELEKNGIGRPSTYAPILSTIQERNYVQKDEKKRLYPTEIGKLVTKLLVENFPEIVDINFTANMEGNLDKIAKGEKNWIDTLKEFYYPFAKNLEKKYQEIKKELEKTEKKCPKCKGTLVIRWSKFGKFLACENFPKCEYKRPLEEKSLKILCPKCKKGEIIEKRTKKGKLFYACSLWPKCDFALWEKPISQFCPKCGSLLVEKSKNFIKCSNQKCDYGKKSERKRKKFAFSTKKGFTGNL